jgi:hypothetical protein
MSMITTTILVLQVVLILHLHFGLFEKSPFGQDLHGLDVFDGSHLISIVLITTKYIKMDLLAETTILLLHRFKNNLNLLASENLLVIHTSDRMENGPHNFRIIDSSKMIADVQAENDLIEFLIFNPNSLIS